MGSNDRHLRLRIQNSDTPHNEKKLKRLYFFIGNWTRKEKHWKIMEQPNASRAFLIIIILLRLTVYQGEREVRRVKTI